MAQQQEETPPVPISIFRETLLAKIRAGELAGREFLLVDLRRVDCVGGTIKGALNLPAETLHRSLPTLHTVCEQAGIELVIWFCGSSKGRGTRAAGWFRDVCSERDARRGDVDGGGGGGEGGDFGKGSKIQSVILEGGIKGWVAAGGEYRDVMDEYVADVWAAG